MKKYVFLPVAIILFALFGCGQATPNEAAYINTEVPLMWRVLSPAGQTMYLFGSIHAADASIYPLPGFIMEAFHRSDYLAVEADVVAFSQDANAVASMTTRMLYADDRTILDDIGEDIHTRATAVLAQQGFPPGTLDAFHPFMWSTVLLAAVMDEAGMAAEYGLDMFFILEAMERGMGILEVESMELQLDIMLGLSPALWAWKIESTLDIAEGADALLQMYTAWQRGDAAFFYALFAADHDDVPDALWHEFYYELLVRRDVGMTQKARQFMAEGKKVFYVVGLAHMLGEDSIIYLLRNYGYTITRVLP
ncbi:MAG: TraB/GumN family protein [Defluviitaleaceae bacterium]|nr:TraB/GumN family protein [Defluviitaleaceae bacterium]MCL2240224.1 TraB/GumN family protein [Defluviitaleaceae bacterium]